MTVNPNASRPVLTLIGKRPIALDAFKKKIRLVEPADTRNLNAVQESFEGQPPEHQIHALSGDVRPGAAGQNPDVAGCLDVQRTAPGVDVVSREVRQHDVAASVGTTAPKQARKKFKPHPYASALPWPARAELFPAVAIDAEPVPADQLRPDKDGSKAKGAARFWCRRIAFEVGKTLREDQREAAERFVLRHRLTVLAAFRRRLARADVVKALGELWAVCPFKAFGATKISSQAKD